MMFSQAGRPLPPRSPSNAKAGAARNIAVLLVVFCVAAHHPALAQDNAKAPRYDYPTAARADYVVGCLAANGFQHQKLAECACGIDAIANQLSYDEYETAETVLSMQQASVGPRGGLFRDTPVAKASLEKLRRAQAEANLRCGDTE